MRLFPVVALCIPLATGALAQPAAPDSRALPAEVVTSHTLLLHGGTVTVTASAGSVRVPGAPRPLQAEVATLAFTVPTSTTPGSTPPGSTTPGSTSPGSGVPAAASLPRPVTFAINGGPGASSAWLNLGAIGPWRIDASQAVISPSAPATLHDNPDTWLDLTDLVFIDPPGTGYSRVVATGDDVRRRIFSVGGDISLLADVIRQWLDAHGRTGAPVYIVGESYGGFRAPRLARALATEQGIGVRGIGLVSPVIDFAHRNELWDPMPCVFALPSQVAAQRRATGRDALADVEGYATGAYMADLWRGERDKAAQDRVAGQVAALLPTIDPALIRRQGGCLDARTFARELHRATQQVGSVYDTTMVEADPFPTAGRSFAPDPALDGLRPLFVTAMHDEYQRLLHWLPEGRYELLSQPVSAQWQWGNSPNSPEAYTALRQALAADPAFRVLVMHGLYDLVTPYMADKVLLDSIPDLGPPGRVAFRVPPGGHMFYTRDDGRAALHAGGAWLLGVDAPPVP